MNGETSTVSGRVIFLISHCILNGMMRSDAEIKRSLERKVGWHTRLDNSSTHGYTRISIAFLLGKSMLVATVE